MLFTAACGSNPVQEDLTSYVNDHLVEFHVVLDEISALYGSVRGDNYTDDQTYV